MKKSAILILAALIALTLQTIPAPARAGGGVTLMTHDSFNASKDVLAGFEAQTGLKVRILKSGDAGAALVQAILSRENPLADVFFGVDNTFLSRAIEGDIFQPHASPLLSDIPDDLKLDPENRLLPVDFGDVCLNYDIKWFVEKGLAPPAGLEDLVKPEYKGLTVVENPATSSPGLAFLLATVSRFGPEGYLDFWKKMRANDVKTANGWEDAYYGHFTRAKGDRPIVVSYASSPPVEVYYAETPTDEAPTGAVVGNGSAFRQIEFIGLLKGAPNPDGGRRLMDFMLGVTFQEDIPLNMFVYPANGKAKLPEVFVKHSRIAADPARLPYEEIARNREKWINAWTDTVLR